MSPESRSAGLQPEATQSTAREPGAPENASQGPSRAR